MHFWIKIAMSNQDFCYVCLDSSMTADENTRTPKRGTRFYAHLGRPSRFGSKSTLQHTVFWRTFRDLGAKPRHFTNFNHNFTIPRGIQHKTRTFQFMRRVNSPTPHTTTISPVLHYRYYTYLKDIGDHGFLIVHFAKHTTKMT